MLLSVLAFLAWQRCGPEVGVRGVAVRTPAEGPGCDGTADVVGVVRTDGRPGTLTYRWARSDGTTSGPLHEEVARGQKQATLHLLWTFHGRGEYRARAELRIRPTVQGAALVMENKTGRILAMTGGFSYPDSQLNRAVQSVRQPGSTMKPMTYLAALRSAAEADVCLLIESAGERGQQRRAG